ncbi:YopX family protein [Phaeocystidibacter luteus]|uniref:YopX protein domain-containing protein n=1 Tax=Phaeocystidibacter luteus TaxID=911197 RepID=A0A6N6RIN4_9FLAO|nr:YopX family protein [Phaeocystidibacter luteus]KAB2810238.1 hypothetical protein F8C67_06550 [Phaeocystidibacter luteus]
MTLPDEKRFRLRKDERVVGYMRQLGKESYFFSKDSFWWTGRKIQYEQIDEWTGYFDKNRSPIYEWDIIHFKVDPDGQSEEGVVLWESNQKRFVIRKVREAIHFPFETDGLQLFDQRQLEVFSYLFINPELIDDLGLSDS